MRYLLLAFLTLTLASCGWNYSTRDADELINASSLYDPPSVTLIKGIEYQFKEGKLTGRDQRFYSQYSYSRALIIGK